MTARYPARALSVARPCGLTTGLIGALCIAITVGLLAPARGQSRPYYSITEIKAKRLKNAVILTIKADGAMTDAHAEEWHYLSGSSPKMVDTLHLECPTGKSKVGDFVDISMYPISHVELEPRSWSNDGIGLNLRIKLYNEARVRHIKTPHISGDWYWDPSMGCCFDGEPGRNKQTFVYTVLSDRFPPPEVTAAEPDEEWFNLDDGPDGTYTLDCLNVDINTLAHEVGRRTGARIMVDESVKRRVTANLPEMTVPELLDGIAQAYGLALESQGGQWVFSQGLTTNVATYQTNVTQVVEVEHLSAQAALDLLPNFLLKYVKPSDAQNALIVAGPPQLVRRVREDVAKIDAPPQQIRIDVTAVKIAKAGAWQHQLEAYASHGQNSLYTNPATGSLSYDHLGDDSRDTIAFLRELKQTGAVDTLAKAHITLVNGKFASLFLGQNRYIQVTRNTWEGDETYAVPIDLGVRLSLMAWTGSKDVVIWMMPVITALGGVDTTTNLPIVDRYETRGAIIVPDGHTLLLGGIRLRHDSKLKQNTSIFGIHSGYGFIPPNRTRLEEDSEIALFITANILGEFATDSAEFSGRLARDLKREGLQLRYDPLDGPPDDTDHVEILPPPTPGDGEAPQTAEPTEPIPSAHVPETGRTQS